MRDLWDFVEELVDAGESDWWIVWLGIAQGYIIEEIEDMIELVRSTD